MSRKIEEVFDLPPMNEREEIEQPIQEEEKIDFNEDLPEEFNFIPMKTETEIKKWVEEQEQEKEWEKK